jgi:membrane protein involved in colicin uptake
MEPYNYVITWYPIDAQKKYGVKPKVLLHGILVADSQLSAYTQMVQMVTADMALEADQIEFMAKPFINEKSCDTKKDINGSILYNFYLNNSMYELRTSTASLDDFIKGTFLNYTNESGQPDLPQAMLMIDVLGIINDDKKL